MKRALTAAAFAALAAALWSFARAHLGDPPPPAVSSDVDMGEQLLLGLRLPQNYAISGTMPLYTLWIAGAADRLAPETARRVCVLPGEAVLALGFWLGWRLAGAPGALGALAVIWFAPGVLYTANHMQLVYAALVLLVAVLLARRAREPSSANDRRAALAVGATLLFRSPLAFLPPLLAWSSRRRGAAAAAVWLAPYLFLVPWLKTNRQLHGQWIPFEYRRADMNIALGAMGLVPNADGDWQRLIKDPPDPRESGAVLSWAAREVFRHPARYASSVAERIAFAAGPHAALCAAAAAGFWLCRGLPEALALALLAAYFLGIHSLMTIAVNYMIPLWPLLAAAAAALPCRRLLPRRLAEPRIPEGAALLEDVALTVLLASAMAAAILVWVYPARIARRPADLAKAYREALASDPYDVWLLTRLGHEELRRGDFEEAMTYLARAADLRPGDAQAALSFAWARALAGSPEALIELAPDPDGPSDVLLQLPFLQAFGQLRVGRKSAARDAIRAGLSRWEATCNVVNRRRTALERELSGAMRPSPAITALLGAPLDELAPKERAELLSAIASEAAPEHAVDVWLALAGLGERLGDAGLRARARARLSRLELTQTERFQLSAALRPARGELAPGAFGSATNNAALKSAVLAMLAAGRPRRALPYALGRVRAAARGPALDQADALVDLARVELALRDYAAAERDARKAWDLAPGSVETGLLAAAALTRAGKTAQAQEVLRAKPRAGTPSSELARWLSARAQLAWSPGDLFAAMDADAREACLADPGLVPRSLLPRAFFDACIMRLTGDSTLLVDRGVARYLAGDRAGGERDFRAALAAAPGDVRAAMSLATALAARGRKTEARAVLAAALAKARPAKDDRDYAAAKAMAEKL